MNEIRVSNPVLVTAQSERRCAAVETVLDYISCRNGRVAQLGEHLLCKQGVAGSIPATSTNFLFAFIELAAFVCLASLWSGVDCAQFCAHPGETWH
jgi:hypothetical protein